MLSLGGVRSTATPMNVLVAVSAPPGALNALGSSGVAEATLLSNAPAATDAATTDRRRRARAIAFPPENMMCAWRLSRQAARAATRIFTRLPVCAQIAMEQPPQTIL